MVSFLPELVIKKSTSLLKSPIVNSPFLSSQYESQFSFSSLVKTHSLSSPLIMALLGPNAPIFKKEDESLYKSSTEESE